jgi:hypothetical protein
MSNSQTWVAYDTISGDVAADGFEKEIREYVDRAAEAAEGLPYPFTLAAASEADWKRAALVIARSMSSNPPRRNPDGIEHL